MAPPTGYLGNTGDMLTISDSGDQPGESLSREGKPLRIVAIDPATAKITRVLFELAGASDPVADPSGTHIILVKSTDGLYRWSQGDQQPTRIASDIDGATWVPRSTSPPLRQCRH